MRVLMLSQSDAGGGAAIAARRLQQGLRGLGVDARMLVRRRTDPDETILAASSRAWRFAERARFVLDKVPLWGYPRYDGSPFTPQWLPDRLFHRIERLRPDLVHVHWIGHGYMHPATLARLTPPLVWTLHDVGPFTGGCHVNLGCTRYRECCGACPRLGSARERDLSRRVWQRKRRAWDERAMTLVAPSTWMARCARDSALFRDERVEVIPNGLDMALFRPVERRQVRRQLDLPADKKLVLFAVASGGRVAHKGFDLLDAALAHLAALPAPEEPVELVLVGSSAAVVAVPRGVRSHYLGPVREEEKMAALYAAADVTVVPSRQESLSLAAIESMACGTPVVAFRTGGVPDVVDHQRNGYLAEPYEPEGLARGLHWVLRDPDRHRRLCASARAKACHAFDLGLQARRHHRLYAELLAGQRAHRP